MDVSSKTSSKLPDIRPGNATWFSRFLQGSGENLRGPVQPG